MEKSKVESSLRIVAKSSIWVFIGIFLSKVIALTYRFLIARYYGKEVYGIFVLATVIVGWFLAISFLGFADGIIRYGSIYRGKKREDKVKYLLRFSTKVLIVTGVVAGALLYILSEYIAVSFFHNPSLVFYLRVFSVLVPIGLLSGVLAAMLRAYEEIKWYSFIVNIFQNVAKLAILAVFILIGVGASSVAWSYVLGGAAMLVLAYWVAKYKIPQIFLKPGLKEKEAGEVRSRLFSYSWPMLFFGVIWMIFYWIDSIFLGYLKDASAVGTYNAAVTIALLLTVVPEIFMQMFFPLITRAYANKEKRVIEELSKQVTKWIFMINLPLTIMILALPEVAIGILFGSEFMAASGALIILGVANLILATLTVNNQLTSAIGKSKIILGNVVAASILNIGLNYVLIPMEKIGFIDNASGLNGAALATLISIVFLNGLFLVEVKYYLNLIPLRRKMFSVLLASIIPGAGLGYYRYLYGSSNLWMGAAACIGFAIIYAGLVWFVRGFDKNDWAIIRSAFKRVGLFNKANK